MGQILILFLPSITDNFHTPLSLGITALWITGFIILLTSIFTFFLFGEIRNLTTFTRLMDCNNGFSISFFFLSLLSCLWMGAQFPQEKFLSYARILTLDFYFLLM